MKKMKVFFESGSITLESVIVVSMIIILVSAMLSVVLMLFSDYVRTCMQAEGYSGLSPATIHRAAGVIFEEGENIIEKIS